MAAFTATTQNIDELGRISCEIDGVQNILRIMTEGDGIDEFLINGLGVLIANLEHNIQALDAVAREIRGKKDENAA